MYIIGKNQKIFSKESPATGGDCRGAFVKKVLTIAG
jgi:hypothetical protein